MKKEKQTQSKRFNEKKVNKSNSCHNLNKIKIKN